MFVLNKAHQQQADTKGREEEHEETGKSLGRIDGHLEMLEALRNGTQRHWDRSSEDDKVGRFRARFVLNR